MGGMCTVRLGQEKKRRAGVNVYIHIVDGGVGPAVKGLPFRPRG